MKIPSMHLACIACLFGILGANAQAAPTQWPPTTELHYDLQGRFYAPLRGSGALTWTRADDGHYTLALSGSSLVSFAYSSSGSISGNWLAPDGYEERVVTRRKTVTFDREHGVLSFSAVGFKLPLPEHLQDSASIFMQLAHQLSTRPQDFAAGQHLSFEVARPSGTSTWDFDITGQQTVQTGAGPLRCWHLQHRGDDHGLGAEVWLAPQLQDLPVQIRLEQGDDNYLLFTLAEARQE